MKDSLVRMFFILFLLFYFLTDSEIKNSYKQGRGNTARACRNQEGGITSETAGMSKCHDKWKLTTGLKDRDIREWWRLWQTQDHVPKGFLAQPMILYFQCGWVTDILKRSWASGILCEVFFKC